MERMRLDGLYLFLLGSAVFVLLGIVLTWNSPVAMGDFRGLYYPARCLIQGGDPYVETEVAATAHAGGGIYAWDLAHDSHFTRYIYFPSAFSLTVPFAMLPWGPSHLLWMLLTTGSLIFASFLIWNVGAEFSPALSGALVGLLLAGSELLIVFGNMAGIAISLCVVAVWCFLGRRFIPAGIVCLALSLAIKPQDSAFVWLYFLLSGSEHRKRALQTLLVTVVLSVPSFLWVWHVAPNWMQELRANVLAFSAPGGIMDPGLASKGIYGMGMLISLQTVVSFFSGDSRICDWISYLVCAPLLAIWMFAAVRFRPSRANAWLALAAISALSMLPVYHRQNDAKLLLLTVPACLMLKAQRGALGRLALLITGISFVVTSDLPWTLLLGLVSALQLSANGWFAHLLTGIQVFTIPFTLLAMGVFYLWIYVERSWSHSQHEPLEGRPLVRESEVSVEPQRP